MSLSQRMRDALVRGTAGADRTPSAPQIPSPGSDAASQRRTLDAIKQLLDMREGTSGSPLDQHITVRDLLDAGLAQLQLPNGSTIGPGSSASSGLVPVGSGTGFDDPRPVLVVPPAPTNLTVAGAFTNVIVTWDLLDFQNFSYTEVWRFTADVIGSAVKIGTSDARIYIDETAVLGTPYYYWVRAVGVSTTGALVVGPFNAVSGTAGGRLYVGGSDIAGLTVQAANLANGSVSASKVAAGAIDSTKFASGLAGVEIVAALPTTGNFQGRQALLTSDNKLYRYTGSAWTRAVDGADITANSITTGSIASGAVTAAQIAAGAITTGKLLVTGRGKALNADPTMTDISAWNSIVGTAAVQLNSASASPAGPNVIAITGVGAGEHMTSLPFPVQAGKRYKVSVWVTAPVAAGTLYIRMPTQNLSGTQVDYSVTGLTPTTSPLEGLAVPTTWTNYVGYITPSSTAVTAYLEIYSHWATGSNTTYVSDFRCEEYVGADLIVDGAIIASKLAAGSIAVGTAAIANGALTNAMIANLAVDNAKIANLDGAKINANSITATQIAASTITAGNIASSTITGGNIAASTITASNLNVSSLSAITATIGTLRTASSGQRMEIADNVIRVYDSSNVLRVKIGNLA